jgi:hypothetical protein
MKRLLFCLHVETRNQLSPRVGRASVTVEPFELLVQADHRSELKGWDRRERRSCILRRAVQPL